MAITGGSGYFDVKNTEPVVKLQYNQENRSLLV